MSRIVLALVLALVLTTAALALAMPCAHANGILLPGTGARERAPSQAVPVRLVAHRVRAKITDQVAEVTVEQVFRSTAREQLEGTYIFPLPEGAVVSDFAMTMSGKMVQGEIVEANLARAIYERIVRRRKDPGLLEYLGRGLFRARVFPIEPGKDLTIRLSFQQVLRDDSGVLELRYPLATDRLNGAPVGAVDIHVEIQSRVDLRAIYSPHHDVKIEREGERSAKVTFASRQARQRQDFLLYIGRGEEDVGFSFLSHRAPAEDGTFMAVLAPRTEVRAGQRAGRDIVFVLDTSGSMAGQKIEQARRALSYGVQILREQDRFSIISFSTGVRRWRDALTPFSDDVRRSALRWIAYLEPVGGTNIQGALMSAVRMARPDRRLMVVFLTDGMPTVGLKDPDELVAAVVQENTRKARIFTFGVGYDLDVNLLDRLASVGEGARDYVAPNEDIEVVTGRFFRKISQPVLCDVKLALGAGVYDVYPPVIGDLFAGTQVVVFGRYTQSGDRKLRLKGRLGGEEKTYHFEADFRAEPGPDYLERLWANRKVAYLLDAIRLNGESTELRTEVVRLATKHAIITPYTSGLVIEEDAEMESLGRARNHLDAPFEGPATNGTIGFSGNAGGAFSGRGGGKDLGTGGGGRKYFDDAAEDGLRWLAAHQAPNGSWQPAGFDRWCQGRPQTAPADASDHGRPEAEVSVTALALSAFLDAGFTNRGSHPFARVVSRAARYLKNVQDPEGCFGPRTNRDYLLAHARATLALVELHGMTGSAIFRSSAQGALDFAAQARNPGAAWGHGIRPGSNDLRVTAWMLSALHSVRLIQADARSRGLAYSLRIDESTWADVGRWLEGSSLNNRGTPGTGSLKPRSGSTGAGESGAGYSPVLRASLGAWIRILLGADARKDPDVQRAVARIVEPALHSVPWDAETAYFATLACFRVGGRVWQVCKGRMRELEVRTQRKDTDWCRLKGSWNPTGETGRLLGRVGESALRAADLTVFYRYPRTGPKPQRAGKVRSEQARAAESTALQRRKHASSTSGPGEVRVGTTRTLGGKRFVFDAGQRWVDRAWDGEAKPRQVEAWSAAWLALLRAGGQTARCLSLGNRVLFVSGENVYEVVPAKEK